MSALSPLDEYESLLETLDILEAEPAILREIKRAEKQVRAGEYAVWKSRLLARKKRR